MNDLCSYYKGLQVILNVGQNEYTSNIGDVAGAVMVVHSQNVMPFPEDEGILLYPGEIATIGMKKVTRKTNKMTRLEPRFYLELLKSN